MLVEELMNEKIFIYLKSVFRSNQNITLTDLNNIKKALSFIYKKENYLNYIVKEYTQYRKKLLDDYLKKKYLSITNYEEIIHKLIDDFKHHFIKEIILLHFFFGSNQVINVDLYIILQMFNNSNIEQRIEKEYDCFIASFKEIFRSEKLDFASFINLLNLILYSFEQITYENFKKISNFPQKQENISKYYNITVMSYLYTQNIEIFSKELNIDNIDNLSLYGFLINNKKNLSKTLAKSYSDFAKSVASLKSNFHKFLGSTDLFLSENNSNKFLLLHFDEFSKIIKIYHNFYFQIKENDKEYLNPKENNQSYKLLFDFFDGLDIMKDNNIQVICKVINLIDNILNKFKSLENFDLIKNYINKIKLYLSNSMKNCVNLIHSLICKQTNFNEENLRKITNYENMINLIEFILDKSQLYFQNLNIFSDSTIRDIIRDEIKDSLLKVYNEFVKKMKNENRQYKPLLAEEEFKNYTDIL